VIEKFQEYQESAARVNLFGSIVVRLPDGSRLRSSSKRAHAIIAYLLLSDEDEVPRTRLQRLLWGQRYSQQAQASLRRELYTLQKLFMETNLPLFRTTRSTVGLNKEYFWLDGLGAPGKLQPETVLAPSFLEELEGISAAFDMWIDEVRRDSTGTLRAGVKGISQRFPVIEDLPSSVYVGPIAILEPNAQLEVLLNAVRQEIANELSKVRWLRIRLAYNIPANEAGYFLSGNFSQGFGGAVVS
jgi:hypothetical protein